MCSDWRTKIGPTEGFELGGLSRTIGPGKRLFYRNRRKKQCWFRLGKDRVKCLVRWLHPRGRFNPFAASKPLDKIRDCTTMFGP
jgi:hypothetical protein